MNKRYYTLTVGRLYGSKLISIDENKHITCYYPDGSWGGYQHVDSDLDYWVDLAKEDMTEISEEDFILRML